jgi:hypothetical protein
VGLESADVCALLGGAGSTLGSSGFTAFPNGDQSNNDILSFFWWKVSHCDIMSLHMGHDTLLKGKAIIFFDVHSR